MPSVSEQASALENHVKQLKAQIDVIHQSVSPTKAGQLYVFFFLNFLFYSILYLDYTQSSILYTSHLKRHRAQIDRRDYMLRGIVRTTCWK
jgi:hypothetical protein